MPEHSQRVVHRELPAQDVHIGPPHPTHRNRDQDFARTQRTQRAALHAQFIAAIPDGTGLLSRNRDDRRHATIVQSGVLERKMSEEHGLSARLADDLDRHGLSARLADDLDRHFEQLVRMFQDRLYGFALRLTGSPQDAEESVQDAFVRAYHALERYPHEQRQTLQLKPWLYRNTLNVVRNRVRRPVLSAVTVDGLVGDRLMDD